MYKKIEKWTGKIGHCPLCGGLCSERIPFPCSKCSRKDSAAADKWIKAHPAAFFAGSH
jgi:hypothetical protein